MGRDGLADVLLVHSRPDEDLFVAEGYAIARYDVMYNDFIIVGPSDGVIANMNDLEEVLMAIAEGLDFVSRGDGSGTHSMELQLWNMLGIDPESNPNYIQVGQGMGATLGIAREMNAFTLTDRATWLNYPDRGDLVIVFEGDERLFNPYGVIPVSGHLSEYINTEGGQAFVDWLTGPSGQVLIAEFGVEEFGTPLFFPDAR
jgi:tungstate transport system substrate-binding protein